MADAHRALPSPERTPAQLIDLAAYRRRFTELNRDATLNAEWDGLLAAVKEAWCWRDPDSLAALEARVARLRAGVLQDWGYPVRKG
jgi:hypothetical protein